MTILSANNTPRVSYTATSSQTAFTIPFEFFNITDLKVYKNTALMTFNSSASTNTTYKVTGTSSTTDSAYEFGDGGTVTFGSGLTSGDIVVIIRETPIERTSDFAVNGTFDVTALNTQQDKFTSMIADVDQQSSRSLKLYDYDTVSATTFVPVKATRANKILSFDTDGNVSVSTQPLAGGVTVSSLSAGASATASYNSSTGVLALGIPAGATGAQGNPGSDGSDGADGTGTFNDFTITDGSTSQTITNGNTLTFTAGANMQVAVSATDTVTITNTADDPVAMAIALG
tara:strand:+ start:477 stop:1337 length:861 start_codon:yes stop_codon:yes gene_type:complete